MGKKDFAHIKAPSRQEKKTGLSMLPFAIVAIAGFCFAAGYWIGTAQHDVKKATVSQKDVDVRQARLDAKTAEVNVLQARIDALREQVSMWKGKAKQDAHSKVGDLQFYTDLPKQSVTPAPVVEPAKESGQRVEPSPVKTEPHEFASDQGMAMPVAAEPQTAVTGFRIQIASFRSREDATALQSKLNKAGFRAYVQTVDLGGRGQWFRTYAGPYASKAEAEQRLPAIEAQMHMKGMLIRGG